MSTRTFLLVAGAYAASPVLAWIATDLLERSVGQ